MDSGAQRMDGRKWGREPPITVVTHDRRLFAIYFLSTLSAVMKEFLGDFSD